MKTSAHRLDIFFSSFKSGSSACAVFFGLTLFIVLVLASAFTARAAQGTEKTTTASANPSNSVPSASNSSTSGSAGNSSVAGKSSTLESEVSAGADAPSDDPQKQPKATLTVRLYVPQMNKRTDDFKIYPYTTAPPKIAIPVAPLPESVAGLRQKIMNAGYNNRQSFIKPYSEGGWRWHYCYEHAVQKSGITVPHLFFQLYSFADDLMPYVVPEAKRINKIELTRLKNYYALRDAYSDNHKDEEMEALRLGLEPVKLNFNSTKKGAVLETSLFISPGDWWITGSHRTPGLIYFWQEPIKVHDGDKLTVELTDANAILIQGGW